MKTELHSPVEPCLNSEQLFRTPSLQNGINLFVCNMSVSDMIMCLTAAPLTPITSFTGQWFLGELPCKILPACQVNFTLIDRKEFVLGTTSETLAKQCRKREN